MIPRYGQSRSVRLVMSMQLNSRRLDHFEDGGEAGVAFAREGLVEAFTLQAGVARQLAHRSGASDMTKRLGNEGGIMASRLKGRKLPNQA